MSDSGKHAPAPAPSQPLDAGKRVVSEILLARTAGGWPRVVVSDLHLGSPHCRAEALMAFLELLPDEAMLILNGDTIDAPGQELPESHQSILDHLARLGSQDRLLWLFGNHDDNHVPIETGCWPAARYAEVEGQLLVVHGDAFDNVMPRYRWFLRLFHGLHVLRMKLGARPVHVARYAKKFKLLYSVLCGSVSSNAVEHALERDIGAIACGHVHEARDTDCGGIRYLNTGCWTEAGQARCLIVGQDDIRLYDVDTILAAANWPPG